MSKSKRAIINGLDEFTRGYINCILFAENDESDESGGLPLDQNYGIFDFTVEALSKCVADCTQFQRDNAELLAQCEYGKQRSDLDLAGSDFWLTRKHHGAGFWDGDLPEALGDKLTEAAHKFGEGVYPMIVKGRIHL